MTHLTDWVHCIQENIKWITVKVSKVFSVKLLDESDFIVYTTMEMQIVIVT